MLNFFLRLVLFALGLVFALSLTVALLLLALAWGLRYAWARLTGKPVTPWVMRFDPRGGFERFRAAGQPAGPSAADVAGARAQGQSEDSPIRLRDPGQVTDVQARPVRGD
jgi:hypothetical protein